MTKTLVNLQELRRKLYLKSKAEKSWRFWGIYVHVCKFETLHEAYRLAKANKGAPGIDGVTFDDVEQVGLITFLDDIRAELLDGGYRPLPSRVHKIRKPNGEYRTLKIPAIRDRVVQGALKLILEPIFDADFQSGSFGYRPKRTAHQAVDRVSEGLVKGKTRVIDVDLKAYFDTIRHDKLLQKVARRINDPRIMHLLKLILKSSGKRGVVQGGVISPLLSNIYLNELDMMLEKAKQTTREGEYYRLEYARFADDLIILVSYHRRSDWLLEAVKYRLMQELDKLGVSLNTDKTKVVNLRMKRESFVFLGFIFQQRDYVRPEAGHFKLPKPGARKALLGKLKKIFRSLRSRPTEWVVHSINPILRGWLNYFRVGNCSKCFGYIRSWVMRKIRRHMMRARQRSGFGWKRWSNDYFYQTLGLYDDYKIRYQYP